VSLAVARQAQGGAVQLFAHVGDAIQVNLDIAGLMKNGKQGSQFRGQVHLILSGKGNDGQDYTARRSCFSVLETLTRQGFWCGFEIKAA
jgi:hypothetical protein